MAAYVDNANPPPELDILWRCHEFGCLPEVGGYLDQDVRLMRIGSAAVKIYSFLARNREGGKSINYAELNTADRRTFDMLRKLEIKF